MSLMELASSLSAGYVPSKCLMSLNLSFGWQGQWWVTTLQSDYAVSMSWWLWKIKKNYNVGEKEEATNGAWGWLTLFAEFPLATRGQSYRMETLNCHLISVYGEYQWVWQKVNAWDFNNDKSWITGQSEVRVPCQEPISSFRLYQDEDSVS